MEVLDAFPVVIDVHIADHLRPTFTRLELDPFIAVQTFGHRTGLNQANDGPTLPFGFCCYVRHATPSAGLTEV
jgi:hypothetical protein